MRPLDPVALKFLVDDLVCAIDNEVWRQRDYRHGLSERTLKKLARAVAKAIREALA